MGIGQKQPTENIHTKWAFTVCERSVYWRGNTDRVIWMTLKNMPLCSDNQCFHFCGYVPKEN